MAGFKADDAVPLTSHNILPNSRKQRICVFCGHRLGLSPDFAEAARELGTELVRRRIGLVYGGGSVGIMGVLSKTVEEGGGEVIGVIPEALTPVEITGPMVGTTTIVRTMHERKAQMARLADCFIALPGGYGTLEEVMEMLTWTSLGFHNLPVGLLNVGHFYDPLLQMFDRMVASGFLLERQRKIIISESSPSALIDQLLVPAEVETAARECQPPPLPGKRIWSSIETNDSVRAARSRNREGDFGKDDEENESKGRLSVSQLAEETGC